MPSQIVLNLTFSPAEERESWKNMVKHTTKENFEDGDHNIWSKDKYTSFYLIIFLIIIHLESVSLGHIELSIRRKFMNLLLHSKIGKSIDLPSLKWFHLTIQEHTPSGNQDVQPSGLAYTMRATSTLLLLDQGKESAQ